MSRAVKRHRKQKRRGHSKGSTTSSTPPVPPKLRPPTVEDLPVLVESLQKLATARAKLGNDARAETAASVFGVAQDCAKSVNADTLVVKRKALDDAEAKYRAQDEAIHFFEKNIEKLITELSRTQPDETYTFIETRQKQMKMSPGEDDTEASREALTRIAKAVEHKTAAGGSRKTGGGKSSQRPRPGK